MLFEKPFLLLLVALLGSAVISSEASDHRGLVREIRKRDAASTNPSDLDGKTFDYVIVGGGLAGLTVASRLSENENVTVAVIEAGPAGTSKDLASRIDPPAGNLYNHMLETNMNWKFKTVPQANLGGAVKDFPRGKVLGGSSAVNGLYYVRHSASEQDAWGEIIGDKNLWGWNNMYRAMKKSENFTDASDEIKKVEHISSEPGSHGTKGPIQVSWPGEIYDSIGAFIKAASKTGAPYVKDPYSGHNIGAYVALETLNPSNWTRSFSRSGYYDPYVYRKNLKVLTGHLVTKVEMEKGQKLAKATGVTYQAKPDGQTYHVKAGREVIMSGGAVNTPQILQLSGIGEKNFLNSKKIDVVVDSPGVGHNLQDHVSGGVQWAPGQNTKIPPTNTNQSPIVNSYTNTAVCYVNGTQGLKDQWTNYLNQVKGNKTKAVNALQAPDVVKKGYELTYSTVLGLIENGVAPLEMLYSLTFGQIMVQTAMQHSFSRGSIMINSTDPFEHPIIDPRYFEQDSDRFMLRSGFKLARNIGQTAPLKSFLGEESVPGNSVQSDEQWDKFIEGRVGTEYHPSGTAAMLPKNKGGVVDKTMKVYGTSNLRVIDASVVPYVVSSHFMSLVYGLAEIGSEIVLDAYNHDMQNKKSSNGGATDGNSQGNSNKGGAADGSSQNSSGKGGAAKGDNQNNSGKGGATKGDNQNNSSKGDGSSARAGATPISILSTLTITSFVTFAYLYSAI